MSWFISISLLLIILGIACRKKSLTSAASFVAFFMGIIIFYAGGFPFLLTLLSFFISSSLITKIGNKEKVTLEKTLYEKSGNRDVAQVLANGALPTICALGYLLLNEKEFWGTAYFISLAVSTGDTWASEIGILSKSAVYSAVTFKIVPKGISGGITTLGLFASLLGSTFIALLYLTLFSFTPITFIIIIGSGFLGTYIDSILGELVQAKYRNIKGQVTEISHGTKKIKGIAFINNDVVNFLSPISVILIYYFSLFY